MHECCTAEGNQLQLE